MKPPPRVKIENVSQKEHDRLCTQVNYSPWTLLRQPCDQPAYRTVGYDYVDLTQLRFCRTHWDDLERALRRDMVTSQEPEWEWLREHVISSAVTEILRRVLRLGIADRLRREATRNGVAEIIRAPRTAAGVVYFIQAGEAGPIKIGTTRNPWSRLSTLQVSSHETLHLRAFQPGGRSVEAAYHEMFDDVRIGGEWFEPVPKLLATIETLNGVKTA